MTASQPSNSYPRRSLLTEHDATDTQRLADEHAGCGCVGRHAAPEEGQAGQHQVTQALAQLGMQLDARRLSSHEPGAGREEDRVIIGMNLGPADNDNISQRLTKPHCNIKNESSAG